MTATIINTTLLSLMRHNLQINQSIFSIIFDVGFTVLAFLRAEKNLSIALILIGRTSRQFLLLFLSLIAYRRHSFG